MHTAVKTGPIDAAALLHQVASTAHGAAVLFVGTVRDQAGGRAVERLEYSAYAGMAEEELSRIATEAASRFGGCAVAAEHRVGMLELGEVSVAIAVAHAHRDEAFAAARYMIEEIKLRVPIWKREHYTDGAREWVASAAADTLAVGG